MAACGPVALAPLVRELPGYRCILLDRPGCGLSSPVDWRKHDPVGYEDARDREPNEVCRQDRLAARGLGETAEDEKQELDLRLRHATGDPGHEQPGQPRDEDDRHRGHDAESQQ